MLRVAASAFAIAPPLAGPPAPWAPQLRPPSVWPPLPPFPPVTELLAKVEVSIIKLLLGTLKLVSTKIAPPRAGAASPEVCPPMQVVPKVLPVLPLVADAR